LWILAASQATRKIVSLKQVIKNLLRRVADGLYRRGEREIVERGT
jgi:hypothetical protein